MYRTVLVLIIWIFGLPALANDLADLGRWSGDSETVVDHADWGSMLSRYLDTSYEDGINRFSYGNVTASDKSRLKNYINRLTNIDPTTLNKAESFAYWVNLYNALTVDLIIDRYPVKSIKDIKPNVFAFGPWKMNMIEINGRELSLDDIEHGLLRAYWSDPRVHYAVNCASIGCPNLRPTPFSAASLDDDLDRAARDYINHPRGVNFESDGALKLSSIYNWFKEDFGTSGEAVIEHISTYADQDLASRLESATKIDHYDYDWTLNGTD
ncbi:DUF547 domain-containing protein [Hyphococcus sp. DH-69]|uniref:DUF547 domain-containing protein n=1 Tax=Hyphococcus formosus TaxID=3143534 RepID=UPI00398B078D